MKSRNFFVQTLFRATSDETLTSDERLHLAVTAIEAILATKSIYEKFKQANPDLEIEESKEFTLDAEDEAGNTPLIFAINNGYIEIVRLLLEAKANPEIANETGGRPLTVAAFKGDTDIIDLLLKAGANPQAPNEQTGKTPLINPQGQI